jgi:hypothetical protein
MLKEGRGSWDDPRARATRGLGRPSLDARSWDHPTHPLIKEIVGSGHAWDKARPRAKSLSWQTQGGRVK